MCRPSTMTASSPASQALENLLASSPSSNKRTKRCSMDSPQSSFSFDMSELFSSATSEGDDLAFPSIEWSFDDNVNDTEDDASTCTNNTNTLTTSKSDSSLLGKRSRGIGGLSRSKTFQTSINLLS